MATTTEPLHKTWWRAVSRLCSFQVANCRCFDKVCPQCAPLHAELAEAEDALREAGEWA